MIVPSGRCVNITFASISTTAGSAARKSSRSVAAAAVSANAG